MAIGKTYGRVPGQGPAPVPDAERWGQTGDDARRRQEIEQSRYGGSSQGRQNEVNRYHQLAGAGAYREGPLLDQQAANEARGYHMGALGLMKSAAEGGAPSAAEVMAKRNAEAGVAAGQSLAGGVKGGPGARIAAARQAGQVQAQTLAQGAQRAEQTRAEEMARAREQYAGTAQGLRGQDLSAASENARLQAGQRALNAEQERFYEEQAAAANRAAMTGSLAERGLYAPEKAAAVAASREKRETTKDIGGAILGGLMGGASLLSDPMAKLGAPPLGGGGFQLGGVPNAMAGLSQPNVSQPGYDQLSPGGGMDVMGSLKAHSASATQFQRDPSGGMMSDMAAKLPAMAEGGSPKKGQPVLVGERGPEVFTPKTSGRILPNEAVKEAEKAVAAKRKAGGYAQGLDMTPIQAPPGYRPPAEIPASLQQRMEAEQAEKARNMAIGQQLIPDEALPQSRQQATEQWEKSFGKDATPAKSMGEISKADEKKREGDGGKKEAEPNAAQRFLSGFAGGYGAIRGPQQAETRMSPFGWSDKDAKRRAELEGVKKGIDLVSRSATPLSFAYELNTKARENAQASADRKAADDAAEAASPKTPVPVSPVSPEEAAIHAGARPKAAVESGGWFDPYAAQLKAMAARGAFGGARAQGGPVEKGKSYLVGERGPEAMVPDDREDAAMAQANRSMEASSYRYKPEYLPPEQVPGEVNVGPMADKMAKDKVAKTAVKQDPGTGMYMLDTNKSLKLVMGGLAAAQKKIDELEGRLAKRA